MPRGSRRRRRVVALAAVLLVLSLAGCGAEAESAGETAARAATSADDARNGLLISAAANLAPVLEEIVPAFEKQSGARLEVNLGSTGQLAQQIEAGAPVDLFLAASAVDIDGLSGELVLPGTRRVFARGRLVLLSRPGAEGVRTLEDLSGPRVARIALANPDHAPYGRAAREALQSAGLWNELEPKLVMGENAQQALQFAESGNVDVAFVPLSLALGSEGDYELVPEELHQPLEQALAVMAGSENPAQARRFADFMSGPEAQAALEKYGYELP